MTTRRDAIARNLCARICDERRSVDELRVIDSILSGLERGADVYGPLDLATDPRDWQMELAEERRDALIYRSCALLSKRDELLGTSPTGRTADFDSVDCGSNPQSRSESLGDRSIGRTPRSERVNPGSSPGPRTSAPARADVSHGNPQAGGGTFSRVELGLRELAAAKPQVAAPGVADDHTLWSAEMVDERFYGSSDE